MAAIDLAKIFWMILLLFAIPAKAQEIAPTKDNIHRQHSNYKVEIYGLKLAESYPVLSDAVEEQPETLSYVTGLNAHAKTGRGYVDFLVDFRGVGTNESLFMDQTLVLYRGLHYNFAQLSLTARAILGYAAVTRKETYLGIDPLSNRYHVGLEMDYEAYGQQFGFAYSYLDPTQKSDEVFIDALKMTLNRSEAQHALLRGQHQFAKYGLKWQIERFWTSPLVYETPMLTYSVDHQATSVLLIEPSFLWFPNWRLWLRWSQTLTKDVDQEIMQAVSGARLSLETLSYYGMGITWDH